MELSDRPSFERLTGLAFFTPEGETGAIPFGNIELFKHDYGIKTKDFWRSIRGNLFLSKRKVHGRAPIYSIQGNQFASPTIPLLLLGEQQSDYAQTATGSHYFTFTAVMGRAVELPQVAATIYQVGVSGADKTLGYDFFVDDPALEQSLLSHTGWVILPANGGTIVAGDVVSVYYSAPALSLEEYLAFSRLSRDGTLVVLAEDEFGPPAREKWILDVTLYCKAAAETHPDRYRSYTMEAAVYGNPIVRRRREPYAFAELLVDEGTVLDLSP